MEPKPINVLSLFDGMSCGQVALERAGIPVKNYWASEIDKYAIQVTQKNYPNTQQLGNVVDVKPKRPGGIDLLIGGSPCQGFSFAGKQLNFDDPRSKLFFEYTRLIEECKPRFFLLENVKMKKEYQDVISSYLGVEPIEINSSLVSAQNRKRLYWTNIPGVEQPKDQHIYLKDIVDVYDGKVLGAAIRGRYKTDGTTEQVIELNGTEKANALTTVQKDSMYITSEPSSKPERIGIVGKGGQGNRIYSEMGKSVSLTANSGGKGSKTGLYLINNSIRKLTPIECERLQTLPDNYTEGVSNTQRYKMIGNGWTVDVIAHIFSYLRSAL